MTVQDRSHPANATAPPADSVHAPDPGVASPEPLFQEARRLYKAGRLRAAKARLEPLLQTEPDHVAALSLLGTILLHLEHAGGSAAEYLERAHRLSPEDPGCLVNLGTLRWAQGRIPEAAEHFGKAAALNPGDARAWFNFGNALQAMERMEEAARAYGRAVERKPLWPRAYLNLGNALNEIGKRADALAAYETAIAQRPDFAAAYFARGLIKLKQGDYECGWRDYEWRFEATGAEVLSQPNWDRPEWDGTPFPGKTLLVWQEQGIGDALQFVRFLPEVKARGGRVLLRCAPGLQRLFKELPGVDLLCHRWSQVGNTGFDIHVPLLSLPRLFGTRLESIPSAVPYLKPEAELIARWRNRIRRDTFNVGVVWSGNPAQSDNHRRSCPLADLLPFMRIPGIQLYSLQKGDAALELGNPPTGLRILEFTKELTDFAETAALIRNLDLVITVDTAVAHLAGALGHPVWTLLRYNHCWRYLLDREDSPWYPTMRLFRQERPGEWCELIARVARSLTALAATRGSDPVRPV